MINTIKYTTPCTSEGEPLTTTTAKRQKVGPFNTTTTETQREQPQEQQSKSHKKSTEQNHFKSLGESKDEQLNNFCVVGILLVDQQLN